MQFIIAVLLSQILQVAAITAGVADVGYLISTNLTHYTRFRTLENGTTISENATVNDERVSPSMMPIYMSLNYKTEFNNIIHGSHHRNV